jgi:hypothetical protein
VRGVFLTKKSEQIIGGHQRLKIYADLGVVEIEAKTPSRELTEDEEKELKRKKEIKKREFIERKKKEEFNKRLTNLFFENQSLNCRLYSTF